MQIPVSWLKEYVDCDLVPSEIAALLNSAGIEVSAITKFGGWGSEVTVGSVTAIRPHPNADRLRLVTVDNGHLVREVVCGAPNVDVGQKIVFAVPGALLHDPSSGERDFHLQPAKIRGIVSEGMVCSERELGLGDEHDGILVLDDDAEVGELLDKVMGDHILKVEPTPNRSDCFGVIGVAREVAVLIGQQLKMPDLDYPEEGDDIAKSASAEIADPALCRRFQGGMIQGLKVKPSPNWLRTRIRMTGERPISNLVDVTNYVMLEIGQPLHVFDYDKLDNGSILVRTAQAGETLVTLDGNNRTLTPKDLMITSGGKPVAMAGVMGGLDSAISDGTTNVLLEAANFEGVGVRRTSHAHKLRTEASLRFEKGLHPQTANLGIRRAMRMLLQLGGGTAAKGLLDTYPTPIEPPSVEFPRKRIFTNLGIELSDLKVTTTLNALGFEVSPTSEGWNVKSPYWRLDVSIPEDLCEELARISGYNSIPSAEMPKEQTKELPQGLQDLQRKLLDKAIADGMRQVISYSALSEDLERLNADGKAVRLKNPISADFGVLRSSLKASLLTVLQHNINHGVEGVLSIVETGSAYAASDDGVLESVRICGAIATPNQKRSEATAVADETFYKVKGVAESLLASVGVNAEFKAGDDDVLFATGRWARIGGVGVIGEVKPSVLSELGINRSSVAQDLRNYAVSIFELNVNSIVKQSPKA